MGLFQSFRQVFVTNSPALLAEGQTVDALAVGQIGILDAKTYTGVTAPTYAKNKALYAVWGTPNIDLGDFGGVPNENEYSKLIKGKHILGLRAKKAQRGQTPVYTIGWSGDVADDDTLFAKIGESKNLFVKISGYAIDRLYSTQGYTKQIVTVPACADDCTDTCGFVNCPDLANQIVEQINADKDLRKFIRAKALISCDPAVVPVTTPCYKFALNACDTGDDLALGLVQAQYPTYKVERTARNGAISTYGVVSDVNTLPASYSSAGVIVPECPTCPAGGTLVAAANVYQVKAPAGTTLDDVETAFSTSEGILIDSGVLLSSGPQFAAFTVIVATTVTDAAVQAGADASGYVATFIGEKRNICELPATTIDWAADGELLKQAKDYRLTIADSICGTNRLVDLQAAYPDLVVTVVNAAGECVHTYQTTINSNCYADGCAIEQITYPALELFEGAEWKPVVVTPTATECKCGVQIETAFVNHDTTECTFDYFPYENDIVHVQFSNYNPDFNADPCEDEWAVKQIRQVKYPQGHGAYIQHLEKESKAYDRRHRAFDPVVRSVQGYSLQADATKFYDEYTLNFKHVWKTSGGWAESYSDTYDLAIYVPEGQGAQLEQALSAYVTSAGIDEDAVSI